MSRASGPERLVMLPITTAHFVGDCRHLPVAGGRVAATSVQVCLRLVPTCVLPAGFHAAAHQARADPATRGTCVRSAPLGSPFYANGQPEVGRALKKSEESPEVARQGRYKAPARQTLPGERIGSTTSAATHRDRARRRVAEMAQAMFDVDYQARGDAGEQRCGTWRAPTPRSAGRPLKSRCGNVDDVS
jgi:hypothetical protein